MIHNDNSAPRRESKFEVSVIECRELETVKILAFPRPEHVGQGGGMFAMELPYKDAFELLRKLDVTLNGS